MGKGNQSADMGSGRRIERQSHEPEPICWVQGVEARLRLGLGVDCADAPDFVRILHRIGGEYRGER